MAETPPISRSDRTHLRRTIEPEPHFLIELRSPPPDTTPELVVRLPSDEVATVEVAETSLTYFGSYLADGLELHRRCANVVRSGRLADVTDLPGSFHVLVSSPDVIAILGDAAGLRRIFYARRDDVWLVSDRADVVARRIDAPIDDRWLALWLLWPPPGLTAPASPWKGVDAVPPGGCLVWRANQANPQVEMWWTPPSSDLALEEGAVDLADALATAVRERIRRATAPSLDLSGGKDTVALAFLADKIARGRLATSGVRLLAVTLPSMSPDNDDIAWARAAAGSLEAIDHLIVPLAECPLPYDDLDNESLGTDQPSVATMHSARRRHLARRLRDHGYGDGHLSGHGGDEVLQAPAAHLSRLLRRRPLLGFARLRRYCALTGTPCWPALRSALQPGGYWRWLQRTADDVSARRGRWRHGDDFGWGVIAPAPPWLTGYAVQLAAEALEQAGGMPDGPLGDVACHATLTRIRAGAATVRLHQQFSKRHGVRMHAPYLDRRVIESALAVRAHERTDPSAFKPLLDAAMASTVPAHLRARPTKGHYTEDTAAGLRRNRQGVLHLVSGARLVDRGLVDGDSLRRAAGHPTEPNGSLLALTEVLSCERWLRSVEKVAA